METANIINLIVIVTTDEKEEEEKRRAQLMLCSELIVIVRPSVRLPHAVVVAKRIKLRSPSLHC